MSMGFTLVFGLVLLGVMMHYFTEQHQRQFIAEQTAINATTGQMIDLSLSHRRDALTQFTNLLLDDGGQLKPLDELQDLLDERIVLHHLFNGGLLLLDADAKGLVDSPIVPDRVGTDYTDRSHVQWVQQHRQPLISNPFIGRRIQTPIFIVNTPVLSQDKQLLGFMIGIILLNQDPLLSQLHEQFKARKDRSFIIDPAQKLFVSSTDKQFIFQPINDWLDRSLVQALDNQLSSGKALSMNAEPIFFSAYPLQNVDWLLVSIKEARLLHQPIYHMTLQMSLIGLLMFFIGLPILYWLMHHQLRRLRLAAHQLKQMPYQPITIEPKAYKQLDEVNQLIQAFNQAMVEQQAQQQKIDQARQEAEQANQTKSRFLAVMSHEIRTPLSAIMGLAEIGIAPNTPAEKQHDCLKKIYLSSEGLKELLNDILDLSKIEERKLVIQNQPFYLQDLVEQIDSQYRDLVQQKGLVFDIQLDPSLSAAYCGDRHRLLQVLNNLLSNALKFTEQGAISMTVEATNHADSNQAWLQFSIQDSGIGMSLSQQKNLFKPFSQGDDSISQFYGGTGLGLTISQDLVRLMGADEIDLTSAPGQGSCFSFSLPFDICTQAQLAEAEKRIALSQTRLPNLQTLKARPINILIVEDINVNRTVLSEGLGRIGFDCYLAENGQEAINLIQQQPIDLVLMDKQMPIMNGFEATAAMRKIKPDLPIIGISADNTKHDHFLAMEVGMNAFLPKPINLNQLTDHICRLLNLSAIQLDDDEANQLTPEENLRNPLDTVGALGHYAGQVDLYHQALKQFRHEPDLQALVLQITELNALKDDLSIPSGELYQRWISLAKRVHRLRGTCAMIGAQGLSAWLETLHQHVRVYQLPQANFIDYWQEAVQQMQAAIDAQLSE